MAKANRCWTEPNTDDNWVIVHRKGKRPRKGIHEGMAKSLWALKGVKEVNILPRHHKGILKIHFKGSWDAMCEIRILDALDGFAKELYKHRRNADTKRRETQRRHAAIRPPMSLPPVAAQIVRR